jgi:hypothetical protein
MDKSIDEATLRLVTGMLQTMQVMIIALEAPGGFDRRVLAYATESRLNHYPANALESLPLAMMLQFLRPDDPPRPVLRLIQGGKS